jgi:hypothetical protein
MSAYTLHLVDHGILGYQISTIGNSVKNLLQIAM